MKILLIGWYSYFLFLSLVLLSKLLTKDTPSNAQIASLGRKEARLCGPIDGSKVKPKPDITNAILI